VASKPKIPLPNTCCLTFTKLQFSGVMVEKGNSRVKQRNTTVQSNWGWIRSVVGRVFHRWNGEWGMNGRERESFSFSIGELENGRIGELEN